jgi:hypothetical protein
VVYQRLSSVSDNVVHDAEWLHRIVRKATTCGLYTSVRYIRIARRAPRLTRNKKVVSTTMEDDRAVLCSGLMTMARHFRNTKQMHLFAARLSETSKR